MGAKIPARRRVPIVPFGLAPLLICEIKRSSPSIGTIAGAVDATEQARLYAAAGIRTLSVLTEEEHFAGSLEDLRRVKEAFPRICVLRKDFLLDVEDVDISHRAGADAVLLIARLHGDAALGRLVAKAERLGLAVLLEVHDDADLRKARRLRPEFTGFNSRDLSTFAIDPIGPVRTLGKVDWPTTAVYESGIRSDEDARFAVSAGFSGLLVGQAVMRDPNLAARLAAAFDEPRRSFWPRLYARQREGRPLVKICGITRGEDARLAARLGADLIGFVLACSQRRAGPELVRGLPREMEERCGVGETLRVGVVTGVALQREGGSTCLMLESEVEEYLREGFLDAVQFHGDESPRECARVAYPHYKALRIRDEKDVERAGLYGCPRVLVDAFSADAAGGTGKTIPENLVRLFGARRPLWLAGGLGPENVGEKIRRFRPELIDASSLLESSPGVKDRKKLERFFEEVDRASSPL
jgi:indole-3-glycerol phosphate synthase/phosphoribosylanthranilate isomerase